LRGILGGASCWDRGALAGDILGTVPRKVRELVRDLLDADFSEIPGGKGSHRKFTHDRYPGAVTVSGHAGDDAKPYQERHVRQAIEEVQE
jgi:predicted RNA binding protein YcfA (HicA-like mRNA interferase family)